jgi:hypothetical protein
MRSFQWLWKPGTRRWPDSLAHRGSSPYRARERADGRYPRVGIWIAWIAVIPPLGLAVAGFWGTGLIWVAIPFLALVVWRRRLLERRARQRLLDRRTERQRRPQ